MQNSKFLCLFFVLFVSSSLAAVFGTGNSQDDTHLQFQGGLINAQIGELLTSHDAGQSGGDKKPETPAVDKKPDLPAIDKKPDSPAGDILAGLFPPKADTKPNIIDTILNLPKIIGKRAEDSESL